MEDLLRLILIITAFVCGIMTQFYIPESAAFMHLVGSDYAHYRQMKADQSYIARHPESPSPTP